MSFGLYLHFPFCANRCHYCDFYKEIHTPENEARFFDALDIETKLIVAQLPNEPRIKTIYIGGGTPSLVNLDRLATWLEQVRSHFDLENSIEFSFETNPETVDLELLKKLKKIGVNRPLFGVQSFHSELLKRLGRLHNVKQTHRAIYHANALEFGNYGIDLIFGLPGQNANMHTSDLEQAIQLKVPHISYYQLIVEPGTILYRDVESGKTRLPDSELVAAMSGEGTEKLIEAGYHHYELSSFALPGHECQHNQGYWNGSPYIGLGPSAHSFIGEQRYFNASNLDEYIDTIKDGKLPRQRDISTTSDRIIECIMLGLRTSQGVSRTLFEQRFDSPLEDHLDMAVLAHLVDSGYVRLDDDAIRLTTVGLSMIDDVTRRLIK